MDIIQKIKPLKASYESLSGRYKLITAVILLSLLSLVLPHETEIRAASDIEQAMVFEIGDFQSYIDDLALQTTKRLTHEEVVAQLKRQIRLTEKVRQYLITQNSPLANSAQVLVQQNNWKKIIALSNAESSMCRKYPEATANCWGVGGSDLWKMGDNLDQAVITMNRFLNNYPVRSPVKYTDMSFEEMNGLYKQPPKDHWVYNNAVVYEQLTELENQL